MSMEIVQKDLHHNGSAAPFVVAIVDDPNGGDTKLIIMFDERDFVAVLSLDSLIQEEDISSKNSYHGDRYEKLRNALWDDYLN